MEYRPLAERSKEEVSGSWWRSASSNSDGGVTEDILDPRLGGGLNGMESVPTGDGSGGAKSGGGLYITLGCEWGIGLVMVFNDGGGSEAKGI